MEHVADALACIGTKVIESAASGDAAANPEDLAVVIRDISRALVEVGAAVMRVPPVDEQSVLRRFYDGLFILDPLGAYPKVAEMASTTTDDSLQQFVNSYEVWRQDKPSVE